MLLTVCVEAIPCCGSEELITQMLLCSTIGFKGESFWPTHQNSFLPLAARIRQACKKPDPRAVATPYPSNRTYLRPVTLPAYTRERYKHPTACLNTIGTYLVWLIPGVQRREGNTQIQLFLLLVVTNLVINRSNCLSIRLALKGNPSFGFGRESTQCS